MHHTFDEHEWTQASNPSQNPSGQSGESFKHVKRTVNSSAGRPSVIRQRKYRSREVFCLHVDDSLVVRPGGILLVRIEAQVDLLASRFDLGHPLAALLVGAHAPIPAGVQADYSKCF